MKTSTIVLLLAGVGIAAYVAYQSGKAAGGQAAASAVGSVNSFLNSVI